MIPKIETAHNWHTQGNIQEADCSGLILLAFRREHLLLWQGQNLMGSDRERGETLSETLNRTMMEMDLSPLVSSALGQLTVTLTGDHPPANWRYPFPVASFAVYWSVVHTAPPHCTAIAPDKLTHIPQLSPIHPLLTQGLEIAGVIAQKLSE